MTPWLAYARLEWRRNRVLYWGWPAIILGSLPFTAGVAAATGSSVHAALQGMALMWLYLGMPLAALMFGGVAGSGLRGRSELDDAPLALSARARVLGAAAAALAGVAASELLLLFICLSAFRTLSDSAATVGWGSLCLTWLTLGAFTASFVCESPIVGGAIAFFLGLAATILTTIEVNSTLPLIQTAPLFVFVGSLAGLLASLAVVAGLPRRPARPWLRYVFAMLLPLAAPLTLDAILLFPDTPRMGARDPRGRPALRVRFARSRRRK